MHSYIIKVGGSGYKKVIVLILVLMEDALVQVIQLLTKQKRKRLNPCFNGRCTRTLRKYIREWKSPVLILVLMEDALVQ